MDTIYFATGNTGKVEEMKPLFERRGFNLERVEVDIREVDALDVEDVARRKAIDSHRESGKEPLIVEDTGFFVDSLGGFPGAKASFFQETVGVEKLPRLLEGEENRSAEFRTAVAFYSDDEIEVFKGGVKGRVPEERRGESPEHLPYNSYFVPEGADKTFAENPGLIQEHSHRLEATEKFLEWLT